MFFISKEWIFTSFVVSGVCWFREEPFVKKVVGVIIIQIFIETG